MENQFKAHSMTVSVGGREISFETGKIARQASGAVVVCSGQTMVLTAACMGEENNEADFLPLRVDYQEKFSSAGKTLGGFIKREGKPKESETLVSRLIDRPLRPMFEEGLCNEVQVSSTVLSYDNVHQPDVLAICGASAALTLSEIPLIKPIGAVRIGYVKGDLVVQPTVEELHSSTLDLVLAGTEDGILMVEGHCHFLSEDLIMEAVEEGQQAIKVICQRLSEWQSTIGKEKNCAGVRPGGKELFGWLNDKMEDRLQDVLQIKEKQSRESALDSLKSKVIGELTADGSEGLSYLPAEMRVAMKKVVAHHMRKMILQNNQRCDGRGREEVRPIHIDMGPFPRTHGSAIFTRGETQAMAICTLGGESMGQRFEDLSQEGLRRFYLQYHFPHYAVGETGRVGPPVRREIGHGKLAERALMALVPKKENFPYTIRLEANITESNGSSSMASVCGGCLALMDAGVPVQRPIAGIAMGLVMQDANHYVILSDILGIEDALGDMDLKVAGDDSGITALQLDIKVEGITDRMMRAALRQAREGVGHILQHMLKACPHSNKHLSQYVPRIAVIKVKPGQIAKVIGPGGKNVRSVMEATGAEIDIEDDGSVNIAAPSSESLEKAKEIICGLIAEVEVGKVYRGKVVSIKHFGLFVQVLDKQGLCHISELASRPDRGLEGYREGMMIDVKVLDINKNGQIRLSQKAVRGDKSSFFEGRKGGHRVGSRE